MIYFMTPDLPYPTGGVKVIHQMVAALVAQGFEAAVWQGRSDASGGLTTRAPVVVATQLDLQPGDVLVMIEIRAAHWTAVVGDVPVVMLVQGADFVLAEAPFERAWEGAYPGCPTVVAAIGTSDLIARFLGALVEPTVPVHHVPLTVESELFAPADKQRVLAFMPRRREVDQRVLLQLLQRRGHMRGWRIEPIDKMTQRQVAEVMARSAVYLMAGEREGFGLPGAEAMAAGCYVVGWPGGGALEYMQEDCSTILPEGDYVAAAELVEAAVARFETDRSDFDRRAALGRERVTRRYQKQSLARATATAFEGLTAAGSPALLTRPAQVQHYAASQPSPGAAGRAYRGVRAAARRLERRLRSP